jgi:2-polyprenyl-3-methyl-5-hydroxy-6-metoxy-1,4-benzoquinol methylase
MVEATKAGTMSTAGFDFGRNWDDYSLARIDDERLRLAVDSINNLLGCDTIRGLTFLDVGCGSGLFSIAATMCGAARVIGVDVNQKCVDVSIRNWSQLSEKAENVTMPDFKVGSALDSTFMRDLGVFDVVYAWGSLHHTGDMWSAISNAAGCVKRPGGTLVMAIYNAHWSCAGWTLIKKVYNLSPRFIKSLFNLVFGGVIYAAKFLVTGRNPLQKERGMDFWYDVIDWLGGYPYEYASSKEIVERMQHMGFSLRTCVPPSAPTGCNEFVFDVAETD